MKDLLVLRLSALGDVIHTVPAVIAIREAVPTLRISWAVEAPYSELVEIATGADAIPVRMKAWARRPIASRMAAGEAFAALRGHRAAVDFQGLVKSALLGCLAGAKTRYGFDRQATREKAALLFTNRRIAVDRAAHVIDQNLELARAVVRGVARNGAEEVAAPGRGAVAAAFLRFAEIPGEKLAAFENAIVLLPGAGRPSKLWPVERFRELARRVGERAVVVWGPGEKGLAEEVGARMCPPTNLRELAWLLRNASVVIGGDTGPLHLAAALGTRVIGLYGPTDPRRNGPYGQTGRCIERFSTTQSMQSISVDDVVRNLEGLEPACD